jgi:precorrin-3B methylase
MAIAYLKQTQTSNVWSKVSFTIAAANIQTVLSTDHATFNSAKIILSLRTSSKLSQITLDAIKTLSDADYSSTRLGAFLNIDFNFTLNGSQLELRLTNNESENLFVEMSYIIL